MNAPAIKINKPVREQVSPEEWEARVNLAACYRLMAEYGMTEMVANHISARVPGAEGQCLLNPYGMLFSEITASSLIRVDLDGTVLFNASDYGINPAGWVIHGCIHRARHDVDAIIHTHTIAGMAVSAMKCGLLPIAQSSMRFLDITYHEYEGIALRTDEQERLVASLGEREAMIRFVRAQQGSSGAGTTEFLLGHHSFFYGAPNALARVLLPLFKRIEDFSVYPRESQVGLPADILDYDIDNPDPVTALYPRG